MIAWLWNIIVGQFCIHKWESVSVNKIQHSDGRNYSGIVYGKECKKCGAMKSWKIMA